jgi:uncharacterized protein involved in exopolysaccharide biosynthesis
VTPPPFPEPATAGVTNVDLLDLLAVLAARWRLLIVVPLLAGAAAVGLSFLIKPTFTAKTVFLPPQQQSAASSLLASLGPLAGLAGGAAGLKSPGDQYVALLGSVNVEDRIIERFKLMEVYEAEYRFVARKQLENNTRIVLGKKDGLISVEVDATEPAMAAAIANQYVMELRRLTSELALTEAQQRRAFFEVELKRAKTRLTEAQQKLQASGFNAGAIKAEPKAAAEAYARVRAEVTSAEVRLQTMRRVMSDSSPEVQRQLALVGALRAELSKLESASSAGNDTDYLGRYRDFKYEETLFELFSKQYEMARLDESREGALIQVVDVATVPEYKSKPKRAFIAVGAVVGTGLLLIFWLLGRHFWALIKADPTKSGKVQRLSAAWHRKRPA